jgi:hypothetical protein
MASGDSQSPDESFFNDLSQQANESTNPNAQDTQNDSSSKVKRIACVLCRKRKLRCDGLRPTCSTCRRLSHDCAYDEVRKKSGPKRGYVKLLEQRLRASAHNYVPISSLTNNQSKLKHFSRAKTSPIRPKMHHARTPPRHTSQAQYNKDHRIPPNF